MKKKFSKVKAVKDASRTHIGTVPPTKVVPHKNKKDDKHKKTLKDYIEG